MQRMKGQMYCTVCTAPCNLRATVQKEATVLVLRAKQAAATFFASYAPIWPLLSIHTLKSAMPVKKCISNVQFMCVILKIADTKVNAEKTVQFPFRWVIGLN